MRAKIEVEAEAKIEVEAEVETEVEKEVAPTLEAAAKAVAADGAGEETLTCQMSLRQSVHHPVHLS